MYLKWPSSKNLLICILLQNTTVLFTSDNGFLFGEWGMVLDKRQPYEVTIRVPSMLSGPMVPKGHVSDLVS